MMSKPSPSARRAVSCHAERESFGSNPTPNRKSLVINGDAMRAAVLAVFGPGSGEGHSHIVGDLHRAEEHREGGDTEFGLADPDIARHPPNVAEIRHPEVDRLWAGRPVDLQGFPPVDNRQRSWRSRRPES